MTKAGHPLCVFINLISCTFQPFYMAWTCNFSAPSLCINSLTRHRLISSFFNQMNITTVQSCCERSKTNIKPYLEDGVPSCFVLQPVLYLSRLIQHFTNMKTEVQNGGFENCSNYKTVNQGSNIQTVTWSHVFDYSGNWLDFTTPFKLNIRQQPTTRAAEKCGMLPIICHWKMIEKVKKNQKKTELCLN